MKRKLSWLIAQVFTDWKLSLHVSKMTVLKGWEDGAGQPLQQVASWRTFSSWVRVPLLIINLLWNLIFLKRENASSQRTTSAILDKRTSLPRWEKIPLLKLCLLPAVWQTPPCSPTSTQEVAFGRLRSLVYIVQSRPHWRAGFQAGYLTWRCHWELNLGLWESGVQVGDRYLF